MTGTSGDLPSTDTEPRPAVDPLLRVATAVAAVATIAVAFLGSGAVIGTPVSEVADGALSTDATLVAPAGPAFAIWSVIYLGLLALAVWQAFAPAERTARFRGVGRLVVASLVLNAIWVLVVQAEAIALSVGVIAALLVVLVVTLVRLNRTPAGGPAEIVLLDGIMGLYLGWVCIATVANTAAALVDQGVDATGDAATTWAELILIVAGFVGMGLAVALGGRFAPALGLGWGLAWVAVARTDAPESDVVAITAALASAATLAAVAVVRWRAPQVDHLDELAR